MPTQSIDLSTISTVNFNGVEVAGSVNLNGTEIWTGGPPPSKIIGINAWQSSTDYIVASEQAIYGRYQVFPIGYTYAGGEYIYTPNAKCWFGGESLGYNTEKPECVLSGSQLTTVNGVVCGSIPLVELNAQGTGFKPRSTEVAASAVWYGQSGNIRGITNVTDNTITSYAYSTGIYGSTTYYTTRQYDFVNRTSVQTAIWAGTGGYWTNAGTFDSANTTSQLIISLGAL